MNDKNTADLIAVFPEMFADLDPRTSMAMFSFECGDGWFQLLKECFEELKNISEKKNLPISLSQVKEKYGTLRVYIHGYESSFDEAIEKAEEKSGATCELCSEPGSMRMHSAWYFTRCDKCWEEHCARYT